MKPKGNQEDEGRARAVVYAGFWRRFLAYVIDMALLGSVQVAITTAVITLQPGDPNAIGNVLIVSALVSWAYFALMESSPMRATVGKTALGLWVADLRGDPISFTRASVRYWLKSLSAVLLGLGYVAAAFTPRKQALHDVLAGTLVLRAAQAEGLVTTTVRPLGEQWNGTRWVGTGSQTEAL